MRAEQTDRVSIFASLVLHALVLVGIALSVGGDAFVPASHEPVYMVVDLAATGEAAQAEPEENKATTVAQHKPSRPASRIISIEDPISPPSETQKDESPLAERRETEAEAERSEEIIPALELVEPEPVQSVTKSPAHFVEVASEKRVPDALLSRISGDRQRSVGLPLPGNLVASLSDSGAGKDVGSDGPSQGGRREHRIHEIRTAIQGSVVYPMMARRRGLEGRVLAAFTVGPDGSPHDITVLESSGYRMFDREVVRVIHAASPYPSVDVPVEVPVLFRLTSK